MKKRPSLRHAPPRPGWHRAPLASLIVLEIFIGVILAGIAFVLFVDLSRQVMTEPFLRFDRVITDYFLSLRSPLVTTLMLFLSFLGGTGLALLAGVTFLLLLLKRFRYEAFLLAITVATGFWLNVLLKAVIARARPETAPLINELFYSFPSGHSMNSFVFYTLLAYLCYHFSRNLRLTLLASLSAGGIILLIGSSRIYLGVHYPSDVVAGYLAGLGWLLTVLIIDRTVKIYRAYNR